ncbi:MAG: glycosyltransferase family 9 protein [Bacteroidales bacterium]|nr:glycosyltransferase family 9 protein [Bacteroidales bacterium]
MSIKPTNIILSRTDNLGDVILTLPMAGLIKKEFPDCRVLFLGKSYTKPIIDCCKNIDEFIDWSVLENMNHEKQASELKKYGADTIIHVFPNPAIARAAKNANIKTRVGTSRRIYHLTTCNRRINLKRRNSHLHEAQLNLNLLSVLGIKTDYPLFSIPDFYGFSAKEELNYEYRQLLDPNKVKLILHPKSKGSAREWGLENFATFLHFLPTEKYQVFVTGTEDEGTEIRSFLDEYSHIVTDLTGKLSLMQLISFIKSCDVLIAASTGPLHIAAALGKFTLGLYAPMRPIHPGRWAPLGKNAEYLVLEKECSKCKKSEDCECIRSISPNEVLQKLERNTGNFYKP